MFTSPGWRWALALALTIVMASSRSRVASPEIADFDKVAHFFVYGLLATLVARNLPVRGRVWLAILIVSVFGASDEWHQSFTPGRSATVADWVADTLGAGLAAAVYAGWAGYRGLLERPMWRIAKEPD